MIGYEPRQPKECLVESHLDTATVRSAFLLLLYFNGLVIWNKGIFSFSSRKSAYYGWSEKSSSKRNSVSFLLRQYLLNMLSRIPWVPTSFYLTCYFKCVLKQHDFSIVLLKLWCSPLSKVFLLKFHLLPFSCVFILSLKFNLGVAVN